MVTIHFFGRLTSQFGREIEFDLPPAGCTVGDLRQRLSKQLSPTDNYLLGQSVKACLGDQIVADDAIILPGQRLEFFPPVSGG